MTFAQVTLESFEVKGDAAPRHSLDFKRGMDAGLAEAAASADALQQQALTDIAATLGDMAFGYAEARTHLLSQIRPLLAQIAESVLPDIAQDTFANHLTETLFKSFESSTENAVHIAVAPSMVDMITLENSTFRIVSDPELEVGQARVQQGDMHVMIDTPALLTALQAALRGLEPLQRTQSNG